MADLPLAEVIAIFDDHYSRALVSDWAELSRWIDTVEGYCTWRGFAVEWPDVADVRARVAQGDLAVRTGYANGFDLEISALAGATSDSDRLEEVLQEVAMWWPFIEEEPLLADEMASVFKPLETRALREAKASMKLALEMVSDNFDVLDISPEKFDADRHRFAKLATKLESVCELTLYQPINDDLAKWVAAGEERALQAFGRGLDRLVASALDLGLCDALAMLARWWSISWNNTTHDLLTSCLTAMARFDVKFDFVATMSLPDQAEHITNRVRYTAILSRLQGVDA